MAKSFFLEIRRNKKVRKEVTHRMPIRLLTWLLEKLGFRRKILYLSYVNWEQIDWREVFTASPWLKAAYKLYPLGLDELMRKGDHELAQKMAARVTADNYQDLSIMGFNLWELSKGGILAALEKTFLFEIGRREIKCRMDSSVGPFCCARPVSGNVFAGLNLLSGPTVVGLSVK